MSNIDAESALNIEREMLENQSFGFIHIAHHYSKCNLDNYDVVFEVSKNGVLAKQNLAKQLENS